MDDQTKEDVLMRVCDIWRTRKRKKMLERLRLR
jgi:hypothetical protein